MRFAGFCKTQRVSTSITLYSTRLRVFCASCFCVECVIVTVVTRLTSAAACVSLGVHACLAGRSRARLSWSFRRRSSVAHIISLRGIVFLAAFSCYGVEVP